MSELQDTARQDQAVSIRAMYVDANSQRRVVVTGMGITSPLGCSLETVWQSLIEGRSGVDRISSSEGDSSLCAGEARAFNGKIDDFGPLEPAKKKTIRKALKLMNRETQFAVAAAQHALTASGLGEAGLEPERIGVCFGAGNVSILPQDFVAGIEACSSDDGEFEFERWGTDGLPQIDPLWLLKCLPNMPACHIAIYNDFRGPNNSITQREAAANLAIAEAAGLIADGAIDAAVTGGTGTTILPFNQLHALLEHDLAPPAADPARVCRPFDQRRTGSVVAEAAAAFVLEEYESAIQRGATIFGEVLGCGSSCVVNANRRPRLDTALVNAMRSALQNARIAPEEVGHIHAHGLSTPMSDVEEARALRDVFRDRCETLPIVAAKSHMGNAGAGSGAVEIAASLLALERGHLFPVLNYEEPDPECPIHAVRSTDVEAGDVFLNLSISPEGQASCLAMAKAA